MPSPHAVPGPHAVRHAMRWAASWVDLCRMGTGAPCAVVFDVDDTLVRRSGRPMQPVIDGLCAMRRAGACVVVVTARCEEARAHTARQLRSVGVEYDALCLHRNDAPRRSHTDVAVEKRRWRDAVADVGYRIVANVGDAASDHTVNHAQLHDSVSPRSVAIYLDADGVAHVKLPTE